MSPSGPMTIARLATLSPAFRASEPICTVMALSRATSRSAAMVGSLSSGPIFSNSEALERSTSEVISGVCT